ncbi:transcription factor [Ganoderma sinense ZZ0214-1]|uniref:Transcription factor n=1 Tax=Ganoderma sinense ZZ0214-1 TaxID=1077348 RepID=A0A2G8SUN9_9APHY|nr:transcription factor [Ganoderma sinense ZZ0214-1]
MASTSSASPPVTSLSDDIQRALQQAVGDANNAAVAVAAHNKTKKSKRHRDEEGAEDGSGSRHVKKKKKSKKHGRTDVDATANADYPGASTGDSESTPAASSSSNESTPGAAEGADSSADVDPPTTSHKKKKKSKGKERAHDHQPRSQSESHPQPASTAEGASQAQAASAAASTSAQPHGGLPASSADFLSAVVAAASATAGHGQQPQGGGPAFEQAMQQYMTYPPTEFDPYAYSNPPTPGGHHPHPPPHPHPGQAFPGPFPPDVAGILPDLHVTSSDELLKSLQEFDISKVVAVLKSLGEAAAAANVSLALPPLFVPGPGPVQQQPVRSEAILGRPPKQKKGRNGNAAGGSGSGGGEAAPLQPDNPDHAHMLANVWMNASKLAEMVRTEGLVYKKGKFSATEDARLAAAVEQYRVARGLTQVELDQIIFSNKVGKEKGHESFWSEITSALQLRPIIAVYHHVRRTRHPFAGKGTWTKTEDDLLLQSVRDLGQQWEKISDIVQRTAADCRDRYRNHLQDRDVRRTGTWSKEEEEELTRIVTEMTVNQGKDLDNDIFWGVLKNTGERPRWSAMDAYILVHKVDSMNVRDDTEIDWKLLPDENWNIWSAHSLQRRWLTMKRSIKGFEEMSHAGK